MARFFVNGEPVDFRGDPATPLLWALRDHLGLMGAKYGCGAGLCGACTVHLDGEAIRSCVTPVSAIDGKRVVTIEGIGTTSRARVAHAGHAAGVEKDVVPCGACQPGQVMSAVALLTKNPSPTDAEIESAMNGNLCRCGTYLRIRDAIRSASAALRKS